MRTVFRNYINIIKSNDPKNLHNSPQVMNYLLEHPEVLNCREKISLLRKGLYSQREFNLWNRAVEGCKKIKKTKEGYSKDGFVVDDEDEDDYVDECYVSIKKQMYSELYGVYIKLQRAYSRILVLKELVQKLQKRNFIEKAICIGNDIPKTESLFFSKPPQTLTCPTVSVSFRPNGLHDKDKSENEKEKTEKVSKEKLQLQERWLDEFPPEQSDPFSYWS